MNSLRRLTARLIPAIALCGFSAACGPDPGTAETPGLIEDDVYVSVMADLMLLRGGRESRSQDGQDTEEDSLRQEILSSHGVSAEQVMEFVEALGGEAGRMEALWEAIAHRYDSIRVSRLQEEGARSGPAVADTDVAGSRQAVPGQTRDSTVPAGRPQPAGKRLERPAGKSPMARDTTAGSG